MSLCIGLALLLATVPLGAQERTVGLFLNDSASFNGYTLFAPMHYRTTYLIDNNGELCHSWQSNWEPGRSVALLENGHLLHDCFQAPFVNPWFVKLIVDGWDTSAGTVTDVNASCLLLRLSVSFESFRT